MLQKNKIFKILTVIIFFASIIANYYLYKLNAESKNRISDLEKALNKINSETEVYTKEIDRLNSELYKLKSTKIVYVPEFIHGESYSDGFEDGKDEGFEEGKEEGREEGYEDGYENGKEAAQDEIYDNDEF